MEELKKLMLDGFAQLNNKIDGVEQRISGMEQQINGVDRRLDSVEQRMDGMQNQMDGMEQQIGGIEQHIKCIDSRLDNLEITVVEIKDSQVRMEYDMKQNFGALYDSREAQIDTNEKMICSLTRIESKLERADLRALYATNKLAHK